MSQEPKTVTLSGFTSSVTPTANDLYPLEHYVALLERNLIPFHEIPPKKRFLPEIFRIVEMRADDPKPTPIGVAQFHLNARLINISDLPYGLQQHFVSDPMNDWPGRYPRSVEWYIQQIKNGALLAHLPVALRYAPRMDALLHGKETERTYEDRMLTLFNDLRDDKVSLSSLHASAREEYGRFVASRQFGSVPIPLPNPSPSTPAPAPAQVEITVPHNDVPKSEMSWFKLLKLALSGQAGHFSQEDCLRLIEGAPNAIALMATQPRHPSSKHIDVGLLAERAVTLNGMTLAHLRVDTMTNYKQYLNLCEIAIRQNPNAVQHLDQLSMIKHDMVKLIAMAILQDKNVEKHIIKYFQTDIRNDAVEMVKAELANRPDKRDGFTARMCEKYPFIKMFATEPSGGSGASGPSAQHNVELERGLKGIEDGTITGLPVIDLSWSVQWDAAFLLPLMRKHPLKIDDISWDMYTRIGAETYVLCAQIAVMHDAEALQYVRFDFPVFEHCNSLRRDVCMRAVLRDASVYDTLWPGMREQLSAAAFIAVEADPKNLQLVPQNLQTSELCQIAISAFGGMYEHIPLDVKRGPDAVKLALMAVKNWGPALRHVKFNRVPFQDHDTNMATEKHVVEICVAALKQDYFGAIPFVPPSRLYRVMSEMNK